MSDDDSDNECPLCMNRFDETDKYFFACQCKYQVCLFCVEYIREHQGGKCPACRKLYDPANYRLVKPPDSGPPESLGGNAPSSSKCKIHHGEDEPAASRSAKAETDAGSGIAAGTTTATAAATANGTASHDGKTARNKKGTTAAAGSRSVAAGTTGPGAALAAGPSTDVVLGTPEEIEERRKYKELLMQQRVPQKNVVYIVGLEKHVANDKTLREKYFSEFGVIKSVLISRPNNHTGLLSAFIAYTTEEAATRAIARRDGYVYSDSGRTMNCMPGTNKYCHKWLNGEFCDRHAKGECSFLHDLCLQHKDLRALAAAAGKGGRPSYPATSHKGKGKSKGKGDGSVSSAPAQEGSAGASAGVAGSSSASSRGVPNPAVSLKSNIKEDVNQLTPSLSEPKSSAKSSPVLRPAKQSSKTPAKELTLTAPSGASTSGSGGRTAKNETDSKGNAANVLNKPSATTSGKQQNDHSNVVQTASSSATPAAAAAPAGTGAASTSSKSRNNRPTGPSGDVPSEADTAAGTTEKDRENRTGASANKRERNNYYDTFSSKCKDKDKDKQQVQEEYHGSYGGSGYKSYGVAGGGVKEKKKKYEYHDQHDYDTNDDYTEQEWAEWRKKKEEKRKGIKQREQWDQQQWDKNYASGKQAPAETKETKEPKKYSRQEWEAQKTAQQAGAAAAAPPVEPKKYTAEEWAAWNQEQRQLKKVNKLKQQGYDSVEDSCSLSVPEEHSQQQHGANSGGKAKGKQNRNTTAASPAASASSAVPGGVGASKRIKTEGRTAAGASSEQKSTSEDRASSKAPAGSRKQTIADESQSPASATAAATSTAKNSSSARSGAKPSFLPQSRKPDTAPDLSKIEPPTLPPTLNAKGAVQGKAGKGGKVSGSGTSSSSGKAGERESGGGKLGKDKRGKSNGSSSTSSPPEVVVPSVPPPNEIPKFDPPPVPPPMSMSGSSGSKPSTGPPALPQGFDADPPPTAGKGGKSKTNAKGGKEQTAVSSDRKSGAFTAPSDHGPPPLPDIPPPGAGGTPKAKGNKGGGKTPRQYHGKDARGEQQDRVEPPARNAKKDDNWAEGQHRNERVSPAMVNVDPPAAAAGVRVYVEPAKRSLDPSRTSSPPGRAGPCEQNKATAGRNSNAAGTRATTTIGNLEIPQRKRLECSPPPAPPARLGGKTSTSASNASASPPAGGGPSDGSVVSNTSQLTHRSNASSRSENTIRATAHEPVPLLTAQQEQLSSPAAEHEETGHDMLQHRRLADDAPDPHCSKSATFIEKVMEERKATIRTPSRASRHDLMFAKKDHCGNDENAAAAATSKKSKSPGIIEDPPREEVASSSSSRSAGPTSSTSETSCVSVTVSSLHGAKHRGVAGKKPKAEQRRLEAEQKAAGARSAGVQQDEGKRPRAPSPSSSPPTSGGTSAVTETVVESLASPSEDQARRRRCRTSSKSPRSKREVATHSPPPRGRPNDDATPRRARPSSRDEADGGGFAGAASGLFAKSLSMKSTAATPATDTKRQLAPGMQMDCADPCGRAKPKASARAHAADQINASNLAVDPANPAPRVENTKATTHTAPCVNAPNAGISATSSDEHQGVAAGAAGSSWRRITPPPATSLTPSRPGAGTVIPRGASPTRATSRTLAPKAAQPVGSAAANRSASMTKATPATISKRLEELSAPSKDLAKKFVPPDPSPELKPARSGSSGPYEGSRQTQTQNESEVPTATAGSRIKNSSEGGNFVPMPRPGRRNPMEEQASSGSSRLQLSPGGDASGGSNQHAHNQQDPHPEVAYEVESGTRKGSGDRSSRSGTKIRIPKPPTPRQRDGEGSFSALTSGSSLSVGQQQHQQQQQQQQEQPPPSSTLLGTSGGVKASPYNDLQNQNQQAQALGTIAPNGGNQQLSTSASFASAMRSRAQLQMDGMGGMQQLQQQSTGTNSNHVGNSTVPGHDVQQQQLTMPMPGGGCINSCGNLNFIAGAGSNGMTLSGADTGMSNVAMSMNNTAAVGTGTGFQFGGNTGNNGGNFMSNGCLNSSSSCNQQNPMLQFGTAFGGAASVNSQAFNINTNTNNNGATTNMLMNNSVVPQLQQQLQMPQSQNSNNFGGSVNLMNNTTAAAAGSMLINATSATRTINNNFAAPSSNANGINAGGLVQGQHLGSSQNNLPTGTMNNTCWSTTAGGLGTGAVPNFQNNQLNRNAADAAMQMQMPMQQQPVGLQFQQQQQQQTQMQQLQLQLVHHQNMAVTLNNNNLAMQQQPQQRNSNCNLAGSCSNSAGGAIFNNISGGTGMASSTFPPGGPGQLPPSNSNMPNLPTAGAGQLGASQGGQRQMLNVVHQSNAANLGGTMAGNGAVTGLSGMNAMNMMMPTMNPSSSSMSSNPIMSNLQSADSGQQPLQLHQQQLSASPPQLQAQQQQQLLGTPATMNSASSSLGGPVPVAVPQLCNNFQDVPAVQMQSGGMITSNMTTTNSTMQMQQLRSCNFASQSQMLGGQPGQVQQTQSQAQQPQGGSINSMQLPSAGAVGAGSQQVSSRPQCPAQTSFHTFTPGQPFHETSGGGGSTSLLSPDTAKSVAVPQQQQFQLQPGAGSTSKSEEGQTTAGSTIGGASGGACNTGKTSAGTRIPHGVSVGGVVGSCGAPEAAGIRCPATRTADAAPADVSARTGMPMPATATNITSPPMAGLQSEVAVGSGGNGATDLVRPPRAEQPKGVNILHLLLQQDKTDDNAGAAGGGSVGAAGKLPCSDSSGSLCPAPLGKATGPAPLHLQNNNA